MRLSVFTGSLALVATTLAMLLIDLGTPGWETALMLCGRGLAFGLITQPRTGPRRRSRLRSRGFRTSTRARFPAWPISE